MKHPRPRGYINLFSRSTQLSTKFTLLTNVKMPIIVGILTFICMIYTMSERLKARNFFFCRYFSFYEQFYNLRARAFSRRNMAYRVYYKPTKCILMGFVFEFYDLIKLFNCATTKVFMAHSEH